MSWLKRFQHFDAYAKVLDDFRVRTTFGAGISIISIIIIIWLVISEFIYYLTVEVNPQLFVDTTRGEKLQIHFDITFPKLPCAFMSVDAMDISGGHQIDIVHNIFKTRLDPSGRPIHSEKQNLGDPTLVASQQLPANYCGSCYGAPNTQGMCCNTCDDVREAYRKAGWGFTNPDGIEQCVREGFTQKLKAQKDEGCRVHGFLEVNKVAGNFHIAPGKSFQQTHMHVHDVEMFKFAQGFNLSHRIDKLAFGQAYPGLVNPLDGVFKNGGEQGKGSTMYQYFLKIVPTIYETLDGHVIKTNQFAVTEHAKKLENDAHGLPGVFFMYDLSPIMVKFTETRRSFTHFLTGVCAIVGGVYTVAGMIDSFIYHGLRSVQTKIELGKKE
jgi:hypothetical protein